MHHVLNECLIDRGSSPSMVRLELYIDGHHVTTVLVSHAASLSRTHMRGPLHANSIPRPLSRVHDLPCSRRPPRAAARSLVCSRNVPAALYGV